jgi:CheY-like chemotaxis protein
MMGELDGYQVVASLKGNPATKNIPVIVVTALDDRDAKMRGVATKTSASSPLAADRRRKPSAASMASSTCLSWRSSSTISTQAGWSAMSGLDFTSPTR